MPGKVYLIPNYLSDSNGKDFISDSVKKAISNTRYYLAENIRTARRFISSLDLGIVIEDLNFHSMDKQFDVSKLPEIFNPLVTGNNLGVISEAGLPGIADPGQLAVQYAHQNNIEVKTFPGGSSMLLALISSGFNGQQYTFHGYLPIDKKDKANQIRQMEKTAQSSGYTQLFMETPYRNQQLLDLLLSTCQPHTLLYCGIDLTGSGERCMTKTISEWKKTSLPLHKIPAMFGIGIY